MRSAVITLLCLLPAAVVVAQRQPGTPGAAAGAAGPAENGPVYSVEVIIFRYTEDIHTGTETFEPRAIVPPEVEPVDEADDRESGQESGDEPGDEAETRGAGSDVDDTQTELEYLRPFLYTRLYEEDYALTNAWSKLELLDAYEPLMHFGWAQRPIAEDRTPALELSRFGNVPEGLDGSVKLYRGRFIHLVMDLSLAAGATGTSATRDYADEPVFGDARLQAADDALLQEYAPLRYTLRETRIMKGGDVRYFDHPRFGAIARFVRVEDETDGDSAFP